MAGDPLTGLQLDELRLGGAADLRGLPAPGVEAAAARRGDRRGHVAAQQDALALAALTLGVRHRHGRHQGLGVRVHRRLVQRGAVGELDDLAEVHHRDAVRDVPDHGEVVRDDHVRQAELLLEVVHEVDDLRLDRHVERGDRLVGHDQLRLEGQRAGDADALPLAAGELVRVAVVVLGAQAHQLQEALDLLLHTALGLHALEPEGRRDDRADGVTRVQGAVRVLEDHLDVTAQRAHLPRPQLRDVPALEVDRAARRVLEAGDDPAHGRLAAARLADDAEGLALAHLEVDAVDGLHGADLALQDPLLDGEVLLQPFDLEQHLGALGTLAPRGGLRLLRDHGLGGALCAFRLLGLTHSFGAISSVQIRVRSSAERWQADQCPVATCSSSGRTVRVTFPLGMSA